MQLEGLDESSRNRNRISSIIKVHWSISMPQLEVGKRGTEEDPQLCVALGLGNWKIKFRVGLCFFGFFVVGLCFHFCEFVFFGIFWCGLCFQFCYRFVFSDFWVEGTRVFKTQVPRRFFIHLSYTPHRNRVFETWFATIKLSLTNSSC